MSHSPSPQRGNTPEPVPVSQDGNGNTGHFFESDPYQAIGEQIEQFVNAFVSEIEAKIKANKILEEEKNR